MIVFIAMILVAAIAATLMITTAGWLQSTAQATSEDSGAQVTDQLLVSTTTGTVNASGTDRTIDEVTLSVMAAPGATEIDLSGATVELVGANDHRTYVYAESERAGAFTVAAVADDDGSVPVLTSRSDRVEIRVPLEAERHLSPGERATVRIVGPSGSAQVTVLNVPLSLRAFDDGDAVEL